jgi:hypothetical protein
MMSPRSVLAFALVVLTAGAGPAEVKKGDKVYVAVPMRYAVAPVSKEEDGLRELFQALGVNDLRRAYQIGAAKRYACWLPGGPYEVIELRDGSGFGVNVPIARLERTRQGGEVERFWIPLQYVRPKDTPLPRGEYRMPVFLAESSGTLRLTSGEDVTLYDYGSGGILATTDLPTFGRYHRAKTLANRGIMDSLVKSKAAFFIEDWTRGQAVDGPPEFAAKGVPAVRVRLADGPASGKEVWVSPEVCHPSAEVGFRGDIRIIPYAAAKRLQR